MSQISVTNLTFNYDGSYDNIFENVSFNLDTNWKLGFIGRNGRGKTTFLKLLMGDHNYNGTINSCVPFDYFPYVITENCKSKDTIELIEAIEPEYEFWKICRELALMQVDSELLYRSFSSLSNGEQTKVLLAVLFSNENHFLLIDEPTNHLDAPTRKIVCDYLNSKKGFILVSHDRSFLDHCIDHVLVINKTDIEVIQSDFSTWWENKSKQDAYEIAQNEKLKHEIRSLTKSAQRTAHWADKIESGKIGFNPVKDDRDISTRSYIGEKSKRMQQRRKNLERRQQNAINDKADLLKNIESTIPLKIIPLEYHKDLLVQVKDFAIYYNDKKITKNLDFTISNHDRIFLQGKNGSGKTSFIKKLLGENITTKGLFQTASGLKISYVSQDTSHLTGALDKFIEANDINESIFKALLRKLDFNQIQFEKKMEDYSAGQKKKVLIAKSLCEQAHLYVWDEPLNYIDIFSRMQIEQLITQFQPTMLIVEHDSEFVKRIATNIILL